MCLGTESGQNSNAKLEVYFPGLNTGWVGCSDMTSLYACRVFVTPWQLHTMFLGGFMPKCSYTFSQNGVLFLCDVSEGVCNTPSISLFHI